jgi:hypothetical protein
MTTKVLENDHYLFTIARSQAFNTIAFVQSVLIKQSKFYHSHGGTFMKPSLFALCLHVTSSPPCWWRLTKDFSLVCFVNGLKMAAMLLFLESLGGMIAYQDFTITTRLRLPVINIIKHSFIKLKLTNV